MNKTDFFIPFVFVIVIGLFTFITAAEYNIPFEGLGIALLFSGIAGAFLTKGEL